jgi:imidazolonepropionase-like amidohydrolase/ABC-type multidrug transport system permease subunit
MKAYLANIRINLLLTFRDRMALVFGYLFPLMFFFLFGQTMGAAQGSGISRLVVGSVLLIGVLGNGFFGGGLRAVQERELGILRRFKVAPTTALPFLVSSLVVGLVNYLPSVILLVVLGHFVYGMPWPERPVTLLLFLAVGLLAFRSVGLIVASIVNSMQESQLFVQMLYLPMMFLSGATFPIEAMPGWLQIVSQFLPASHLFAGIQGILVRGESLGEQSKSIVALLLTLLVSTFLALKLFRWEKEEKVKATAKLWLVAALLPFVLLGVYQAYSKESLNKQKILARDLRRNHTYLIRDVRVFVGDGQVIEAGSVLIKDGKIVEIFTGTAPDAKKLQADVIEGSGKTLLPGLIDVHVHLGAPGGAAKEMPKLERHLAQYLYSGVTAVRSVGDGLSELAKTKAKLQSGEELGAELFFAGPMFTAEGGHGTEYFDALPEMIRSRVLADTVRTPKTVDEARKMVDELAGAKVDAVKIILESGMGSMLFKRFDPEVARATAAEARQKGIPVAVHTGSAADMAEAVAMGANSIEHGSARDVVPVETWQQMAKQGTMLDPTMTVVEAFSNIAKRDTRLLEGTLVQQVALPGMIAATKAAMLAPPATGAGKWAGYRFSLADLSANVKAALANGVELVAGTDSGNFTLLHGPAIHRELQLLVQAGATPSQALQAATTHAAKLLGAGARMGAIRPGYQATLLLVDGNPLEDIAATERISTVFLQGERVNRARLIEVEKDK